MNRLFSVVPHLLGLLVLASIGRTLAAEETRYETKDGMTYRVTRRVEKRPVAQTRLESRTQSVYTTEFVTEMRETTRMVWVPVTQNVYVPRWHRWWNPIEAYVAYEPRQVTRWELRMQTVREPVTIKQQVPQERIVQMPVRSLGFVEESVEERIAVNTAPARTSPTTPVGGFAERPGVPTLNRDFPRLGQPATNLGLPLRR